MQASGERINNLLNGGSRHKLVKGEVWIGSAFMQQAGFEETLDNHFRIAKQLGQEVVCLPVSERKGQNETLGYQYFEPEQLSPGLRARTRCLAAVIDGPFQRMVNRHGLMAVLTDLTLKSDTAMAAFAVELEGALALVDRCLEKGVDAIVLADDFAGEQAPLMDPRILDDICTPFYARAVLAAGAAGAMVFLHGCGNLSQLLPMIALWHLDGLAAIQVSKNDMDLLDSAVDGIFMAGIEAALLEKESPLPEEMEALRKFIGRFAGQGRLILCSSCGLYRPEFWGRLQRIYAAIERDP